MLQLRGNKFWLKEPTASLCKTSTRKLVCTILFQDISYFGKENVGTLITRLAGDCQRLSHVIGNDLQLILRNTLQERQRF
ncbi:ABC transporter B family member 26, chloroplastic [Trifolium repens]|nr:ABC transporter B family member 26, chloroplastic [Trifolium repens]